MEEKNDKYYDEDELAEILNNLTEDERNKINEVMKNIKIMITNPIIDTIDYVFASSNFKK